jgi:lipoprotein-releasing system permease protein
MTLFFAWRYLRSKKSTNAINIIAWISIVAIAVVTAALVVVLSVFNGFEDLVKQMYGDFYPALQVTSQSGKWVENQEEKWAQIRSLPGVALLEPVIEERAILLDAEEKSIVWLKGVSAEYAKYSGLPQHMLRGEFFVGDSAEPRLVIGAGVEHSLQISASQSPYPVTIYLPNPEAGPSSDPLEAMLSSTAYASGSFAVQQEFDDQYAFTHIDFLRYMLGENGQKNTAYEVFVTDAGKINSLKKEMSAILGSGYVVKDRYQQNQALFAAMQTEKLIIYAVAFLILVIAGFNIISSLTMTVLEKQKDIAVLKALGADNGMIRRIFLLLGVLLACSGAIAGLLIGLLICLGQLYFQWVPLGGQSFIIQYYPVAIRLFDLLVISGIVITIALLAAWIPSRRAVSDYFSLR